MIRGILRTVLALSACITPVMAQGVTHTYANGWMSSDFPDPGNPGCSIGSDGSMPGSRVIMGASMRRPAPVNLVIRRTGWMLPDAAMRVQAQFPDGTAMTLFGHGHGQTIDIDLDAATLPGWVHMLTASPVMQLAFDGNEPPWQVDLAGTTKVVNAMGDCFKNHNISGVPAPFTLIRFAQTAPYPADIPTAASGASPSFAEAMSQMGRPRPDVAPPVQPAPAPAPVVAPRPVATSQTLDCASITSAQDRLDCYDGAKSGGATPVTLPPAAAEPSNEERFITVVQSAADAYANAANDMQAGGMRAQRAERLCQAVPGGNVVNWSGRIERLSSNNSGYGVLTIRIAPDVTVGTTNNEVSDALAGERTLIPPGSPLFAQASSLSVGTRIRFSGHLLPGRSDCFSETSVTQSGSMKSPEFMVRFISIAPE